ncbi:MULTISPECIES: putative colanic acid biosynthesis acetyltransferase [Sphingobacterium]|uniref:putative colanic acid biosynthesis acetyltransferase n=1 Tax=Sphingobacterium TaxID=28453 RepID=UPI00257E0A3D|nr:MULTISPECIES: putative colanic acid biosynthesis acetyltransferase [Sphingobacterium]
MEGIKVDHSQYKNELTLRNRMGRLLWNIICFFLFRPFVSNYFNEWRKFLLKLFGAKIGKGSVIYSSVKIWAPWNLDIGEYVALAQDVNCYNVNKIIIKSNATISQSAYLCSASHDISDPKHPLISAPIIICDQAWVATDTFVGMGVTIGQGAVIGARAAVFKDVEPWVVVGGNPAKFIKTRKFI